MKEKLRRIRALTVKEFREVLRDNSSLAMGLLLPLILRQPAIRKACIDADVIDFESLVVELLPELDERILDDGTHLCVIRVERRIDGTICADGDAQCQVTKMLRLEMDDHLRVLPALDEARLINNLPWHLVVCLRHHLRCRRSCWFRLCERL